MKRLELWLGSTPKHLVTKKRKVLKAFRRAQTRRDHRAMSKWARANTKIDLHA